ncbi:helix-turn-helix domain-containing protein [Thalassomonas viridans]|uniref:Helix-turn-helix domain-containing protein n=1 Tax=Thalassomonas viridans TaxID=137584 RepID=A0AAF0C6H3_9GAMM|nr:AraC family transcriptional regulator [Thalassomonas viridans]WDE04332.1 helix-turn-helix domain-containing protein [Thalassomonas viridans]
MQQPPEKPCQTPDLLTLNINAVLSANQITGTKVQVYSCAISPEKARVIPPGSDENQPVYASFPIIYHNTSIGALHLEQPQILSKNELKKLSCVTKKLALLIKRYQATSLSNYYLGKTVNITPYSDHTLKLDAFIEIAASTRFPVIIRGEFGSEKLSVASAIHYNSALKHQAFIEVDCSTPGLDAFEKNLRHCFEQGRGGSIFLHAIDELPLPQQQVLSQLIQEQEASHEQVLNGSRYHKIRFLVSTTRPLTRQVISGEFSRQLYLQLNFLNVQLAPLNERKQDIPEIVDKLMNRHRLYPEQCLSEDVKESLCRYSWPGNYQQLERVLIRLLTLASSNPIQLGELHQCAPEILSETDQATQKKPKAQKAQKLQEKNPPASSRKSAPHVPADIKTNLIPHLLNKNYPVFSNLHPALQKALCYIAENYCEEMSLKQLAGHIGISASHLCALFKSQLNNSYKQIITELKIEKARQLFISQPQARVADIAHKSGFGDISHFEKAFKRFTDCTPRAFKNALTHAMAPIS